MFILFWLPYWRYDIYCSYDFFVDFLLLGKKQIPSRMQNVLLPKHLLTLDFGLQMILSYTELCIMGVSRYLFLTGNKFQLKYNWGYFFFFTLFPVGFHWIAFTGNSGKFYNMFTGFRTNLLHLSKSTFCTKVGLLTI